MKKIIHGYGVLSLAICIGLMTWSGWINHKRETFNKKNNTKGLSNIIYIVVDTLRADVLSAYGNKRIITPNMDALASDGILFENAFSTSNWTIPATTSLLTAQYPSTYDMFFFHSVLPKQTELISETLKKHDYVTAAISGNGIINDLSGFSQGFDYFDSWDYGFYDNFAWIMLINKIINRALKSKDIILGMENMEFFPRISFSHPNLFYFMRNNYRDGKEITDQSLKLIKKISPASFFLYLQYFDPHLPYMKHPYDFLPYTIEAYRSSQLQGMTDKEKKEFYFKPYLDEVKFADEQIGRLIGGLKDMDLYDKTIIVLTSDHGEQIFEHGWIGHSLSLYNEEIKIPLIIKGIHDKKSMRVSDPVSMIDIPPTILDMVSIDSPASFEGKPLKPFFTETDTQKNKQLFSMMMKDRRNKDTKYFFSQINNNFKYIIYSDRRKANTIEAGKEELYDLKQDQYEKNNIIAENDKIASEFRAAIRENIMKLPDTIMSEDQKIDGKQFERLKALGYIQ